MSPIQWSLTHTLAGSLITTTWKRAHANSNNRTNTEKSSNRKKNTQQIKLEYKWKKMCNQQKRKKRENLDWGLLKSRIYSTSSTNHKNQQQQLSCECRAAEVLVSKRSRYQFWMNWLFVVVVISLYLLFGGPQIHSIRQAIYSGIRFAYVNTIGHTHLLQFTCSTQYQFHTDIADKLAP